MNVKQWMRNWADTVTDSCRTEEVCHHVAPDGCHMSTVTAVCVQSPDLSPGIPLPSSLPSSLSDQRNWGALDTSFWKNFIFQERTLNVSLQMKPSLQMTSTSDRTRSWMIKGRTTLECCSLMKMNWNRCYILSLSLPYPLCPQSPSPSQTFTQSHHWEVCTVCSACFKQWQKTDIYTWKTCKLHMESSKLWLKLQIFSLKLY